MPHTITRRWAWLLPVLALLSACGPASGTGSLTPASSASAAMASATPTTVPTNTGPPTSTVSASPSSVPTAFSLPGAGAGSPAATLTLTNSDAGHTASVQLGASVTLRLQTLNGYAPWQIALPDRPILTPLTNPPPTPAPGVAERTFRAVAVGQTALTATTRPSCGPGQPCVPALRHFAVTVIVTA